MIKDLSNEGSNLAEMKNSIQTRLRIKDTKDFNKPSNQLCIQKKLGMISGKIKIRSKLLKIILNIYA